MLNKLVHLALKALEGILLDFNLFCLKIFLMKCDKVKIRIILLNFQ